MMTIEEVDFVRDKFYNEKKTVYYKNIRLISIGWASAFTECGNWLYFTKANLEDFTYE